MKKIFFLAGGRKTSDKSLQHWLSWVMFKTNQKKNKLFIKQKESFWDKYIITAKSTGDLLSLIDYYVGNEANQRDCKECRGIEWVLCAWPSIQDDEEVSILELLCTEKEGEELSEKSKQRPDWKNMRN